MIRFSSPFLATDRRQLDALKSLPISCVEAVIFNRQDLFGDQWIKVWQNVERACALYTPQNVVFHFPVNDSDYVDDAEIRNRLYESYSRLCDLGLAGMVVHSNRIKPIEAWRNCTDLAGERNKVVGLLDDMITRRDRSDVWVGLENMPVMDNHGIEIDPLFCFPADFDIATRARVSVTWDFCHYTNSLANMTAVQCGAHRRSHYPNIATCGLRDVETLADRVVHWHFSAFKGVANPDTNERCIEGVLPVDSTLGEEVYAECFQILENNWKEGQKVTLEIGEEDYVKRINLLRMLDWFESLG